MIYLDQVLPIYLIEFNQLLKKNACYILDTSLEGQYFINQLDQEGLNLSFNVDENGYIELICEIYFTSRKNPLDHTPISLICTQRELKKGFCIDFNGHFEQEVRDKQLEETQFQKWNAIIGK